MQRAYHKTYDGDFDHSLKCEALRNVLILREHIPNKFEAYKDRRQAATRHHGPKNRLNPVKEPKMRGPHQGDEWIWVRHEMIMGDRRWRRNEYMRHQRYMAKRERERLQREQNAIADPFDVPFDRDQFFEA